MAFRPDVPAVSFLAPPTTDAENPPAVRQGPGEPALNPFAVEPAARSGSHRAGSASAVR